MEKYTENSYKYFENRECEHYPCHKTIDHMNCLFCYCPLYRLDNCPGNFSYVEHAGKCIKDCSHCLFPHKKENYDIVISLL